MLFKTQCDKTDRAQLIWLNFHSRAGFILNYLPGIKITDN